jgi:helicase MOV-10
LSTFFPPSDLCRVIAYSRPIEKVLPSIKKYIVCDQQQDSDGLAVGSSTAASGTKVERMMKTKIVISTLSLAARFGYWGIPRGHFSVVCVDEAAQAIEPEVVAVASSMLNFDDPMDPGQLILAGDPQQLGPIVTSRLCRQFGYDISYMERLMKRKVYGREGPEYTTYPPDLITKLLRNYRSHKELIKLPNKLFYENELIPAADIFVANTLATWEYLPQKKFPLVFHAVNGENQREGKSPSWFNEQEAEQVIEYCRLLLKETRPPLMADEIGVITPYAQQATKIRKGLEVVNIHDIKVGSVETFQGQERRCIIISTVRSDSGFLAYDAKYSLGFIANAKRFNVAMTRAKALLIVIGCPQVLATDQNNWLPLLKFCHRNKSWLGEKWDPNYETDDIIIDTTESNAAGIGTHMAEQEAIPIMSREE